MMRSVASVCLKLSNLTSLPCFHTFFQLHHDQSSTLHHFFFQKCFFLLLEVNICKGVMYKKLCLNTQNGNNVARRIK